MKLQEQLDSIKEEFMCKIPPEKMEQMLSSMQQVWDALPIDKAVKVGDTLPNFSLPNQDGEIISSNELFKKGKLIISFFRGVWCPNCNLELKALEEYSQRFSDAGANIVLISPQTQDWANETVRQFGLSGDVLCDIGNKYATELGITLIQTEMTKEIYRGFDVDLPKYNGDDSWLLPAPTRIVVDMNGKVIDVKINPDHAYRKEPCETLETLALINSVEL